MSKFVTYLRTSTQDQQLGIEAQRTKAQSYAESVNGEIVAEYSEHESGKNNNRPELEEAIRACKKHGATLLLAKLDRLSRSVAFLFELKERLDKEGVKVVIAEFPEVMENTLTLGIFATLAQRERELISERTKAALQAKKARGERIGREKGCDISANQKKAVASIKAGADLFAQKVCPVIKQMAKTGTPLSSIANTLNEQGIKTRRGGKWTATAVKRVLSRCN